MSKVDQASWITISITLTPDDIFAIEDAIVDLEYCAEVNTVGILEHIVEQYNLKKRALDFHEAIHKVTHILHTRKLT
jgi:hypothetical protein